MGLANLASLLMVSGVPYDSEKGRTLAATLAGILTGVSYRTSALMAACAGPFTYYDINKKHMKRVIRNHARVAGALDLPYEELNYLPIAVNHVLLKRWASTL